MNLTGSVVSGIRAAVTPQAQPPHHQHEVYDAEDEFFDQEDEDDIFIPSQVYDDNLELVVSNCLLILSLQTNTRP